MPVISLVQLSGVLAFFVLRGLSRSLFLHVVQMIGMLTLESLVQELASLPLR